MRRKRKQHEEPMDETWLIPYSDLLTLLLALFILLFASSQIDAEKFEQLRGSMNAAFQGNISFFENTSIVDRNIAVGIRTKSEDARFEFEGVRDIDRRNSSGRDKLYEQFQQETVQLEALKEELDRYIGENQLDTELEVHLNHDQLKIIIRDHALFASGSAQIRPESSRLAREIARLLAEYDDFDVAVSGHTDSDPINTAQFRSNWDLSAYRALNFMKELLRYESLDPSRFSSVGYGEYQPIASNDTAEGKAKNRRVEISIIRNFFIPTEDNTISVDD